MAEPIEYRLPVHLLEKSIQSGSEYGWRQNDVLEVIEAARQLQIGIEGGLVQYVFEEGTCELYWLHYYTDDMKQGENWAAYCNRTAKECADRFRRIVAETDIRQQAIDNFSLINEKIKEGVDIDDHKLFILSFEEKRNPPAPPPPPPAPAQRRGDRRGERRK